MATRTAWLTKVVAPVMLVSSTLTTNGGGRMDIPFRSWRARLKAHTHVFNIQHPCSSTNHTRNCSCHIHRRLLLLYSCRYSVGVSAGLSTVIVAAHVSSPANCNYTARDYRHAVCTYTNLLISLSRLNPNQVASPTFGYTGGAMVVLDQCVVSQGDTGVRLVGAGD